MRKLYKILPLLVMTTMAMTSCLDSDKLVSSPECYINSFSVGDITSKLTIHRENASDTVVSRTISGSSVRFNIDHVKGIVASVDSLPKWADISKVVPSFNVIGNMYAKWGADSLYYVLQSGKDTINFEKPLEVMVVASDGVSTKKYTVRLNRYNEDTDTIVWKNSKSGMDFGEGFKALARDGHVFVFGRDGEGRTTVCSSAVSGGLSSWTVPTVVSGGDIDNASVLLYKDEFYALGTDGCIYKAEERNRADAWKKVCDKSFVSLLAADGYYLYAYDGKEILGTEDFATWIESGSEDMDMLPTGCVQSFSYRSKTNPNIQIAVMSGISEQNSRNSINWYKITSDDSDINQDWMYIQITNDNGYAIPKFKDISSAYYNGKLYAIGIDSAKDEYRYLYVSEDNGITWHAQRSKYPIPAGLKAAGGAAKMVSADGRLWIIQKDGNVWSGTIK